MIIVKIHGGQVTEVANIPLGVTVEVRDYDVEGEEGPFSYDEEEQEEEGGSMPYTSEIFGGDE
jgi:hypothetical protein